MKNTNRNLDDLFAAARQEEPVISKESARDLLRRSEHMQPSFTLFSTKGIIMTTLGLSLASLTTYFLLGGSPQAPQKNITANISVQEPKAKIENLFAQRIEEPKKTEPTVIKLKKIDKKENPSFTQLEILTPLKVQGIKPIEISPEKFIKLGIKIHENGGVSFSQKNEHGEILTMIFPQNTWGIILPNEKAQKEILDAPSFSPLIVTDTKGNRRLMQFTHKGNGFEWKNMQIESRGEGKEFDPAEIIESIVGRDSESVPNHLKELKDQMKNDRGIKQIKKVIIKSYIPSKGDSSISRTQILSTINENVIKVDSGNFGERMERAKEEMQIRIKRGDNEDSLINLALSIGKMLSEENQEQQLERLVPILVRPSTSEHYSDAENITYDDGLIFWYRPEKEINDIVPEAAQATEATPQLQNKVSVIIETAVYPNPAHSKATIRFSLSEPRTVAFSIHDLLGKRVMEAGTLNGNSAGSIEKELDLSELPAGVYLLVITTDKGEQTVERLAIEK